MAQKKTKSRVLRVAGWILGLFVLLVGGLALTVKLRYGGGERFPDRTTVPALMDSVLETVADLRTPPGNIAVSADWRVFLSLHPEGRPEMKVAELVDRSPVPWPDASWQSKRAGGPSFETVLSLRIDALGRLWTLDLANHGLGDPKLLAFDVATGRLVHEYHFSSDLAPIGSHLNDFQVDATGEHVYIADASIFRKTPALIVYDVATKTARRVLEGHPAVMEENFVPYVGDDRMEVFGLFSARTGIDSIALDRKGEWLYFAAVTSSFVYRARAADLADAKLSAYELAQRVEPYALKTMSDGMTTDLEGNVYWGDMEHSAILSLGTDRKLHTLLKSPRLRWPDGFSFGPSGWLYVTCSSLDTVIMKTTATIAANAPYQVFRFRPGPAGIPGH